MKLAALQLDFVAARRLAPHLGAVLLLLGIGCVAGVAVAYWNLSDEQAGLQLQLEAAIHPPKAASRTTANGEPTDEALVSAALRVPWIDMLSALEHASLDGRGKVTMLAIEPDRGKRIVRITAQAATLADALWYVERLQAASTLHHPVLIAHDARNKGEAPYVQFQVLVSWGDAT